MTFRTLEGQQIDMRAECEFGHPRKRMNLDHVHKMFYCEECGKQVAPERIWNATDERYRPSGNLFLSFMQSQLDYEIVGVITASGDLFIEYPRREQ